MGPSGRDEVYTMDENGDDEDVCCEKEQETIPGNLSAGGGRGVF